ncbi:hypothetical protein NEOKW01_0606 [Nematocida sp. AWRm80]|nr:hypothetical protein NEOKW01_0606 [Nematocida sp. AWRm80]
MGDTSETTVIHSSTIQACVKEAIKAYITQVNFCKTTIPIDNLKLYIKAKIVSLFPECLNVSNKDIKSYANGICSAIEISMGTEEESILNKLISDPQMTMTNENKKELERVLNNRQQIDVLEQKISSQLNDMVLGLLDVETKLKDDKNAIKQFNYLINISNIYNSLIKDQIIDKLEATLAHINRQEIPNINYTNIHDIEEVSINKALYTWNKITKSPSDTIGNMHSILDGFFQNHGDAHIQLNQKQQEELKDSLRFFKTLANHLPEIVNKKYHSQNLSIIHSDENQPFFKRFSKSAIDTKELKHLVKDIDDLYKIVYRPSLLDKFKSFSLPAKLVLVLHVIAMILAIISLLIYIFVNKDAIQQMFV